MKPIVIGQILRSGASKELRKRNAMRHVKRIDEVGKEKVWEEIKKYRGFWGDIITNELIQDMKAIMRKNDNH